MDEEESRHAIKVLRYVKGDELTIVDGKGNFYTATISNANAKKCEFEIINSTTSATKSYFIHIAIAPTKNIERIEWFVEKAVEIGIDEISLIICENSERKIVKTDRIQRKAISAMKQSLKAWLPTINEPISFSEFVKKNKSENRFIAFVDFSNPIKLQSIAPGNSSYTVLIGPEGDFSLKEVDNAMDFGFKKVSLGKNRLRTETAGITSCHLLNLINE